MEKEKEELREKFLVMYPKITDSLRDEIIVLNDGKTYSWNTVYFEVKNKTKLAQKLLNSLREVGLL
jgi:UV DNA damage repair endonuclease